MKKAQNVDKKQQNVKLRHILHVQCKKSIQFPPFFDNFLFWVKSKVAEKMGAILDDVTGPPAAAQPVICTISCRARHRLFAKGETFSKYCNITKP